MGKIDSMVGTGQGFPGEAGVYFARNKVTVAECPKVSKKE
jgi:hypothetical protein